MALDTNVQVKRQP